MAELQNKIDFIVLVTVNHANANGDPLNEGMPRTDYNGYGEISDVCIKRKIRNRMQDLRYPVFVQNADHYQRDNYNSLKERADAIIGKVDPDVYAKKACETWLDVRSFGQLFAFKGKKKEDEGTSIGIRGPVTIRQAVSVSPVEIESMQITKSVNGEPPKAGKDRSSDTMGTKHFVRFGLYVIKGSINVQLADKTGFSEEDAEIVKECLRTLFENDASSARPEGSMEVVRLYWWKHSCKEGQYSSAKVHRSLHIAPKEEGKLPESLEDYTITLDELPGLTPEVSDGI